MERYKLTTDELGISTWIEEHKEGDWVKHSDVEKLIEQNKTMREALKTAHKQACSCCDSSESVKEHCYEALKSLEGK